MAYFAGYPNLDPDDMERLHAIASYKPRWSFEEAFAVLECGSPRDVAERAYADFVEYWTPPADYVPPKPITLAQ